VSLSDQNLVREEYSDERRLAIRAATQEWASGPNARQVVFEAVAEAEPRRVLEVGPGQGELAERILRELGPEVVAVDQSQRMVDLTRARGVEAVVGDVLDLPFPDGAFDCVAAAWMLYHVPDVDRAVRELRRVLHPEGRLVAATNSERSLHELWDLIGYVPDYSFGAENGEWPLLRHFTVVERRDVRGMLTFPDREAAYQYLEASINARHLADRLPFFEGSLRCSRHVVVFVCEP
jgi:ubiquinone/menaquinone biosynthesis C-methylase UbiE